MWSQIHRRSSALDVASSHVTAELITTEVELKARQASGELFPFYGHHALGPDPARVCDLQSIRDDLAHVVECCERMAGELLGSTTRRALWESAVISYRRCFEGGRSHGGPGISRVRAEVSDLESLGPEAMATHDEVWIWANKHVAHQAGELEAADVVVVLAPPTAEPRVLGTIVAKVRNDGGGFRRTAALRDLAIGLGDLVEQQLQATLREIQEDAQANLTDVYLGAQVLTGVVLLPG
jgi:hypothetical protein